MNQREGWNSKPGLGFQYGPPHYCHISHFRKCLTLLRE